MAYEFHNPGPAGIDFTMPRSLGLLRIGGGEYLPTPEQEEQGLTAEFLEDLVPNLLRRTPPVVRRRLLEERGIEVPSDLISGTVHVAKFQRTAAPGREREPVVTAAVNEAGSKRHEGAVEHAHALGEKEPATSKAMETTEPPSKEPQDEPPASNNETSIPLVEAIAVFLSRHSPGRWSGTCSELLAELGRIDRAGREANWPGTPQQLGTALRRHKGDLEGREIELLFERKGKSSTRVVTLSRRGDKARPHLEWIDSSRPSAKPD